MPIEEDVKKTSGINSIKSAFDELSKDFDIGTLESFTEDLAGEKARRSAFDELSKRFDIGTFESFSEDLKPFLPPTGIEKVKETALSFGKELANVAEDFLFTIPTLTGERKAESETAKFLGKHGIVGATREGILRALPLSPEAEQEAREFLVKPLIPLRDALPEDPPEFFTPDFFGEDMTKVSKGLYSITKGVARIVEGLSSPENLALILGTAGVGATARAGVTAAQTAGRIIPAIFSADMISQEPELVEGVVSAIERGDADEAIELTTVAALNAGIAFGAGREALRRSTVEAKLVISNEAKPYFDRLRKALEDDEKRASLEKSAEEYNILLDDINQNAAKARLREVAGEVKNTRRKSSKSIEEEFGIILPKESLKVEGEFGITEPTRPRKAITFAEDTVVKPEGKPVKELLNEVKEIGNDENLKPEAIVTGKIKTIVRRMFRGKNDPVQLRFTDEGSVAIFDAVAKSKSQRGSAQAFGPFKTQVSRLEKLFDNKPEEIRKAMIEYHEFVKNQAKSLPKESSETLSTSPRSFDQFVRDILKPKETSIKAESRVLEPLGEVFEASSPAASRSQEKTIFNKFRSEGIISDKFDVDLTFSIGAIHKRLGLKEPDIKLDKNPQAEGVTKADVTERVPVENTSVDSVFFDPPFVVRGGSKRTPERAFGAKTSSRFGTFKTLEDAVKVWQGGVKNAARILKPGGKLVVKIQDTIGNVGVLKGERVPASKIIIETAKQFGLDLVEAKSRKFPTLGKKGNFSVVNYLAFERSSAKFSDIKVDISSIIERAKLPDTRIKVSEVGDIKLKNLSKFKQAVSFLESRFPRLMSSIDSVKFMSLKEFSREFPGDLSSAVFEFDIPSNKTTIVFKEEGFTYIAPLLEAKSPQLKGIPSLERKRQSTFVKNPSVEQYVDIIAHEFRHNRDLIRFGFKGFQALEELGAITSKADILKKGERIVERGLRPQRYLVRLSERRARAQSRTAVRAFKEQFKERTTQIKAFSKSFAEEGYDAVRHDLNKAWELYESKGRSFEEFSKDLVDELGEGVSSYIDRLRSEKEIQGTFPGQQRRANRTTEETPEITPVNETPKSKIDRMAKEVDFLKEHDRKWYQALADLFSTEAADRRLDAHATGLAKKTYFGKIAQWHDIVKREAENLISVIHRKGTKPDQIALQELALLAETNSVGRRIRVNKNTRYDPALQIWDNLKGRITNAYKERGERFSFRKDMVSVYEAEIRRRSDLGENVRQLNAALPIVTKLKNGTPEAFLWMSSLMKQDVAKSAEVLARIIPLDILKSKKVDFSKHRIDFESILKTGIVKPEELNIVDIMTMLGRRTGKDIGMLDVRSAMVKDGLAKKLAKGEHIPFGSQWSHAPDNATFFKNYAVHPVSKMWLTKMFKPENKGLSILDKGIAHVKMHQFFNFLFLPMYDIVQASIVSLRPHLAGTAIGTAFGGPLGGAAGFLAAEAVTGRLFRGMSHVLKMTPEYTAIEPILSSTPFNNPFNSFRKSMKGVKNTLAPRKGHLVASALSNGVELLGIGRAKRRLSNGERALKVMASMPVDLFSNFYNLSWGTAWLLDRGVRMSTYLELKRRGFTRVEAAQTASRFHADYAGTPLETRKVLNRFAFTPTFKIEMAKTQLEMIISAIKGIRKGPKGWADIARATFGGKGTKVLTPREAQMASSLFYAGAALYAFHLYMQSQGFDTETFANKYSRSTLTDEGPKDLVITAPNPLNLYIKYWDRVKDSFSAGPNTAAKGLFNRFKWEITPIFRVGMNWLNNKDDSGDPIILNTDSNIMKIYKSAKYLALNSYQALGLIGGDEEQAEARKKLAEETSNMFSVMSSPFTFAYTKDPDLVIGQSKINKLMRQFSQDIKENRIAPDDIPAHSNRLLEQMNEIIEDTSKKER